MCGIFALVHPPNIPVSPSQIRSACSLMHHRGPDQAGYALLHNKTIGFGHNRLSIQSPDAPPQPLVDPHTGTTILYNGEVYDHIGIGHSLVDKHNVTLADSTDTAVVLALYILYGPTPAFFSLLNGEFAFVIWDPKRKQVLAVRDRFGIKPLYWYYDHSKLVYSSEIKAIASLRDINRKFSTDWLDTIDPGFSVPQHLTFIEGIYNVLPGQYITMDIDTSSWSSPQFFSYFSALPLLKSPNVEITYDEAKKETRRLVTAAIKRRLVADRPVCVYLSGGVDSTIVCSVIRSLGHPLTCITIGFGDHVVSEENIARKTADYYSLPHKCVTYTLEDTAKDVERTIYHTEIPLSNPQSIAKLHLSEFARQEDFVVSLTGEGSDEILLGYSPFRSDLLLEMRSRGGKWATKAEQLRQKILSREGSSVLTGAMPDEIPRVRGVPSWQAWHFRRLHLLVDSLRAPYANGHSLPNRSLETFAPSAPEGMPGIKMAQIEWLGKLHNYVIPCLADRVEMACSIEGRPPLLDAAFTEFALRLPQDYLLDPETLREKRILYDAFDDLLPPHIRTRTKQPFLAPPWSEALFGTKEGRELIEKYLSRDAIRRVGVWSYPKIDKMLAKLRDGEKEWDAILGLVLSIQILHALFIEGEIVGDPDFPMIDRSPYEI